MARRVCVRSRMHVACGVYWCLLEPSGVYVRRACLQPAACPCLLAACCLLACCANYQHMPCHNYCFIIINP